MPDLLSPGITHREPTLPLNSIVIAALPRGHAFIHTSAPAIALPPANHISFPTINFDVPESDNSNVVNNIAWYSITLNESIPVIQFNTSGSDQDTMLGIYDSLGNLIEYNDDATVSDRTSSISRALAQGTYYIAIGLYPSTFNAHTFDAVGTDALTGNIRITAISIAHPAINISFPVNTLVVPDPSGSNVVNNVAWYSVVFDSIVSSVQFDTRDSRYDTMLGVYDSTGNLIGFNDDVDGGNTTSLLILDNLAAGVYYIAVGLYPTTFNATNFDAVGTNTIIGLPNLLALGAQYTPPTPSFTFSPQSGPSPLTVNFTDTSVPHSSNIISWQWDFGDGYQSAEQNPTHAYTISGNETNVSYTAYLTITDALGSGQNINDTRVSETLTVYQPPPNAQSLTIPASNIDIPGSGNTNVIQNALWYSFTIDAISTVVFTNTLHDNTTLDVIFPDVGFYTSNGNLLLDAKPMPDGPLTFSNLSAGTYYIAIASNSGYSSMSPNFSAYSDSALNAHGTLSVNAFV